jgi:hypothetical protein
MKTLLRNAVAAACIALAVGAAHAAADPLQNAIITASYNGAASAMLGLDHGFADEAGSNVSALDVNNPSTEFLTSDWTLAFDFAPDGHLTIYNNGTVDAGQHVASFDFGSTLGAAITGFSVTDSGVTDGTPVLTIVNSHTISIDLTNVVWNGDFSALETAIVLSAVQAVPEPATYAMLLAGLASIGLATRRRKHNTTHDTAQH